MQPPLSPEPTSPWPTALAELASGERLIVRAFRHWVVGLEGQAGHHWSLVWNDFARSLGARDGRRALTAWSALVRHLQGAARRTIRYHHPGCPCLGPDEVALVAFLAACQGDDRRLARGLAEWLVTPEAAGGLLQVGLVIADCLREHAVALPARRLGAECRPAPQEPPTRATAVATWH